MHRLLCASRGGALIVAIASAALAGAPAHADDIQDGDRMEQARRMVASADIDYKLGRFTAALDKYTRAYELYPVAPLLFNIGQCHKNLREYAKAIFFFEGYLRDAPRAPNRTLVEDLVREAKAELDKTLPEPAPPANPPEPAVVDPPVIEPTQGPVSPTPRVTADHPGRSRLVPGVMLAGGATVLAAGGVLYYYGQKDGPDEMYVYDDTRLLGGIMMAVGGAALVTGAILWFRTPAGAPVAAITPEGGFVAWAGSF